MKMFKSFYKFLSSLKLAVISIIFLAVLTSVGTIVESRYDALTAAKLVYKTGWMYFALGLLAINLLMVMVDRWPWKKRHAPFIFAHIGIIVLLIGSLVTALYGLDGSMRIEIGGSNRFVTIPETEFRVWSSFDGDQYSKILDINTDFFSKRPEKHPVEIDLGGKLLKVVKYAPYALIESKIQEVKKSDSSFNASRGSAVRIQLKNPNVNLIEWVFQKRQNEMTQMDLGPASIQLGGDFFLIPDKNYIHFKAIDEKTVQYNLISKNHPAQKGLLKEGDTVKTPWMGIELRLISYYQKADQVTEVKEISRPTEISNAAIQLQWGDQLYWLQLNDILKIFTSTAVHLVSYGNKRIDTGVDINLKKFDMGLYQGTQRAASYSSLVTLPDQSEHLISMNEPLKHNGLTYYQASFQQDDSGKPVASVLSVNHDPGRWLKYLGSLILSFGVVLLFWYRRKQAQAQILGSQARHLIKE